MPSPGADPRRGQGARDDRPTDRVSIVAAPASAAASAPLNASPAPVVSTAATGIGGTSTTSCRRSRAAPRPARASRPRPRPTPGSGGRRLEQRPGGPGDVGRGRGRTRAEARPDRRASVAASVSSSPWFGADDVGQASSVRSIPSAGAGLRTVRGAGGPPEPERLADGRRRRLVADEHDVAGAGRRSGRRRRPTAAGREPALAPDATEMRFSPRRSTRIRATPVGAALDGRERRDVDALEREGGPRFGARTHRPRPHRRTATGRPSRAAATAWLPPLPPWWRSNVPPVTVSPGRRQALAADDEVDVDRPDDDDPTAAHRAVTSR